MSEALFLGQEADPLGDSIPPIWTIDHKDEEALLAWDKRASDVLLSEAEPRLERTQANLSRYRGAYLTREPVVGGAMLLNPDARQGISKMVQLVANHIHDLVEQKVANQLKYRPDYEVSPDSQELQDKQHAIGVKKCLDSIDYWSGIPKEYHKVFRHAILSGQSYILPYWDKLAGKPTSKEEKISFELYSGERKTITRPIYRGDIRFKLLKNSEVFLFPTPNDDISDCPGFMWERITHVDELRAMFPDKDTKILPTQDITATSRYASHQLATQRLENCVVWRCYYFRSTPFLPEGLTFSVTNDCVLASGVPLDISLESFDTDPFGNLPIARLTDVDLDDDLNGFPSFSHATQLQHIYDQWLTLCLRNVMLFCHGKIFYQQNTVDAAKLAAGSFLVPYRGAQAPQFVFNSPLTQDLLKFGEIILTNEEKVMRISGVSRGSPPPGTRAAASLYFYDEQEETASVVFKRKIEDFVVRLQRLKLALISKYWSKDKEKLIWVLGKDKEWLAESIDLNILKGKYSIRIKSASNLPDSKFARIQALLDIAGQFPDVVTKEHVLEMLEFGQQEKFIDYARTSVMAAEGENERLMRGEDVESPQPYELQTAHWKTHNKLAQDPNYKKQPKEIQRMVEEHIGGHEMIMLQLGEKNSIYKQALQVLEQFPLFAPLPPMVPGLPPPQAGLMPPSSMQPPNLPPGSPQLAMSLGGEPTAINDDASVLAAPQGGRKESFSIPDQLKGVMKAQTQVIPNTR
jgi:hypothetical protein